MLPLFRVVRLDQIDEYLPEHHSLQVTEKLLAFRLNLGYA